MLIFKEANLRKSKSQTENQICQSYKKEVQFDFDFLTNFLKTSLIDWNYKFFLDVECC